MSIVQIVQNTSVRFSYVHFVFHYIISLGGEQACPFSVLGAKYL